MSDLVSKKPVVSEIRSSGSHRFGVVSLPKHSELPQLVDTHEAAVILGRSSATLKRWRHEGIGPDWVELEGRVSYDVAVLVDYIRRNTRVASVRAAMEEAREAV